MLGLIILRCCAPHLEQQGACAVRSVWLNQYARQFIPIIALLALRGVVGIGGWIVSKYVLGAQHKQS